MRINYFLVLFKSKVGQGMVEYALLVALIALVVLTGLIVFGNGLLELYNNIRLKLTF